jgi:transcriptional regulator
MSTGNGDQHNRGPAQNESGAPFHVAVTTQEDQLELTTRKQKILLERAQGATVDTIGDRYSISHQRVSVIVLEATEHINKLEVDLMVARKEGVPVAFHVPYQRQEDRVIALEYLDWVLARLKDREVEVNVIHQPTTDGNTFFLSDV